MSVKDTDSLSTSRQGSNFIIGTGIGQSLVLSKSANWHIALEILANIGPILYGTLRICYRKIWYDMQYMSVLADI